MQRPVMNPSFFESNEPTPKLRLIRWDLLLRVLKLVVRILLTDPLTRRPYQFRIEEGSMLGRFVKGLLYRLAFVPFVIVLIVLALVFAGTHPPRASAEMDPSIQGIYYDPVNLLSEDGTRLEAWLVPAINAKRVLAEKERALKRQYPAVVLVHDFGQSRQDMLPLVRPLHEAGFVVLAVNLRGSGSSASTGATFGLKEAMDVRAAAELLRRRSYVDPERIAVLGVGTGASAALLAADSDPRIAALVLQNPARTAREVIEQRIGPHDGYLRWMQPLCKWTFEMTYKVDAESLDLANFRKLLASRPALMLDPKLGTKGLDDRDVVRQVGVFLRRHLTAAPALASGT